MHQASGKGVRGRQLVWIEVNKPNPPWSCEVDWRVREGVWIIVGGGECHRDGFQHIRGILDIALRTDHQQDSTAGNHRGRWGCQIRLARPRSVASWETRRNA